MFLSVDCKDNGIWPADIVVVKFYETSHAYLEATDFC